MTVGESEDNFRIGDDPSVWSSRRSGLEMVRGKKATNSPEAAAIELAGLRATEATWLEWRGIEYLPLAVAFALHHYLDPRAMGLLDRTSERFEALMDKYGGSMDSVLFVFSNQLIWLVEYLKGGRVLVEEVGDPLEDSIVSVRSFLRMVSGQRVLADPCPTRSGSDVDAVATAPRTHSSIYLRALIAASDLFVPISEGGSYVPDDPSTMPDVDTLWRERFPSISATKRRQMREMIRPFPKGRPPKPR